MLFDDDEIEYIDFEIVGRIGKWTQKVKLDFLNV